jgi:hypothetical protein
MRLADDIHVVRTKGDDFFHAKEGMIFSRKEGIFFAQKG